MKLRNHKFGKFFGPSFTYTGYALIIAGIFAISYSATSLFLLIPGLFIAFTSTGTIIDTENKKVRPYTLFFGLFRTGKWIEITRSSRFSIEKARQRYTLYSRANNRFDMDLSFINLLLINKDGTSKVKLNQYNTFEDAQKEMDELTLILFPGNLLEDTSPEEGAALK
jgi:hypothetical protein